MAISVTITEGDDTPVAVTISEGVGPQGLPGTLGEPGTDGNDGATGQTGADGQPGAPGSDGSDGADGSDGIDGSDANITNANVNAAIATDAPATRAALGLTGGQKLTELPLDLDFLAPDFQLTELSATLPALEAYPAAHTAGCGPMHTSALHFPDGFGGYQYWMAYTPYLNSGAVQYENPSIAVSHDGIEWIDHPSITNPIDAFPGGATWNSDTNLVWIDGALYVFWRYQGGANDILYYRRSTDGLTFEPRVAQFTSVVTGANPAFASSAIVQEPDGSLTMFGVDYSTGYPYSMHRWTAPDLETAWTHQGACTLSGDVLGSIWHGSVRKIGGKYILLYSGGSATKAQAFFAESVDGDTFTVAATPIADTPFASLGGNQYANYKPDFLPIIKDGRVAVRLYLSESSFFNYGVAEWGQPISKDVYRDNIPMAINLYDKYLLGDDFVRADAAAPGSATSGQAWTVISGGLTIDGNRLRGTAAGNNRISIDVGVADVRVGMRFATIGAVEEFYIMARYSGGDYIRFGRSATERIVLQSINGGTIALGQIEKHIFSDGDWIMMELEGDQIRFYVNGSHMGTATSALNETATSVGIQCAKDLNYVDGFFAETL